MPRRELDRHSPISFTSTIMNFNNFTAGEFTLADAVGICNDASSVAHGNDAGSVDYANNADSVGYGLLPSFETIRLPSFDFVCPDARENRTD